MKSAEYFCLLNKTTLGSVPDRVMFLPCVVFGQRNGSQTIVRRALETPSAPALVSRVLSWVQTRAHVSSSGTPTGRWWLISRDVRSLKGWWVQGHRTTSFISQSFLVVPFYTLSKFPSNGLCTALHLPVMSPTLCLGFYLALHPAMCPKNVSMRNWNY